MVKKSLKLTVVCGIVLSISIVSKWVLALATVESTQAVLVNTIDTWRFQTVSPDPTGLAYDKLNDRLIISDSEVNEIAELSKGINVFSSSRSGSLERGMSTLGFSREPAGIALDSVRGHLYVSDDDSHRIFRLDPGPDNVRFSDDDIVSFVSTLDFGSSDPEGLAFDDQYQTLYVVDGKHSKLFVLSDIDQFFGASKSPNPALVHDIGLMSLAILDPEGIEFDGRTGRVYIVDARRHTVSVLSKSGKLVQKISLPIEMSKPSGITIAPSTQDSNRMGLYISDRGIDNNVDPTENDGRVYEFLITPPQD
ncbi:MAG: hypothetical protein AAF438_04610 [Pseudomonadota bacterium]